jgi:hypothetical protein
MEFITDVRVLSVLASFADYEYTPLQMVNLSQQQRSISLDVAAIHHKALNVPEVSLNFIDNFSKFRNGFLKFKTIILLYRRH